MFEDAAQARQQEALKKYNCLSENGITTRVQGKHEAPPGLDMRAQQQRRSPHGGGGGNFNSNNAPASASTAPNTCGGRQRVFKGVLPRHCSTLQEDSDSISMSSDDEDSMLQNRGRNDASSGSAVATNGGSETQTLRNSSSFGSRTSGTGATTGGQQLDTLEPSRMPGFSFQANRSNNPPTTPSAKRKRSVFQEDSEDEFGGADLADSDTERQLAAIADESARKQRQLQTQGSARSLLQQPQLVGAGAGTHVERNGGLPTPRTNRNSLRIVEEESERRNAKRQRTVDFAPLPGEDDDDDNVPGGGALVGNFLTPTPYRKTDALAPTSEHQSPSSHFAQSANQQQAAAATPSPQTPAGNTGRLSTPGSTSKLLDYPKVKDEVMAKLSGQRISETTRHIIEDVLMQHERRVQGLVRGRDITRTELQATRIELQATRTELQARDAQIASLQARVVHLENGRKLDQGNLKKLREASEFLRTLSQPEEEASI